MKTDVKTGHLDRSRIFKPLFLQPSPSWKPANLTGLPQLFGGTHFVTQVVKKRSILRHKIQLCLCNLQKLSKLTMMFFLHSQPRVFASFASQAGQTGGEGS
jgi:hypothetical protein